MAIFLTVVVLTLGISALCSLFEAALYSTRLATLEAAAAEGRQKRAATKLLEMKRKIAVPTAAILILNTMANTAGASIAGMYATDLFSAQFGHSAVYVFSGLLTVAILLLSEILPKTYGATHWKTVWPWIVTPLRIMQTILAPVIWVAGKFTSAISRKGTDSSVTEDEILGMIRLGAREGELTTSKLNLLNGVFRFDNVVCRQVMDPRGTVVRLDATQSFSDAIDVIRKSQHTRYPLCRGSLDEVLGVIHVKDLLGYSDKDEKNLEVLARPLDRVPETLPVTELLKIMQETRKHMCVVVDEHGTTVGIVTLERILEQIVGDIQDEFDKDEPEIKQESPDSYQVRGHVSLERINRELDVELLASGVDTLSGFLVTKLGRLPREGDRVKLGRVRAKVLEVAQDRAQLVALFLSATDDEEEPAQN